MIYLDKIGQEESQNKLKTEESFPISGNGYTLGRLLDGMKCQLLLWRYRIGMCGWYMTICLFLDNSDSPSIVEQ